MFRARSGRVRVQAEESDQREETRLINPELNKTKIQPCAAFSTRTRERSTRKEKQIGDEVSRQTSICKTCQKEHEEAILSYVCIENRYNVKDDTKSKGTKINS